MDLIFIKDLENIVQDRYGDTSLKPGISHIFSLMRSHYRRSEHMLAKINLKNMCMLTPSRYQDWLRSYDLFPRTVLHDADEASMPEAWRNWGREAH